MWEQRFANLETLMLKVRHRNGMCHENIFRAIWHLGRINAAPIFFV
jgi:hypothetical protein